MTNAGRVRQVFEKTTARAQTFEKNTTIKGAGGANLNQMEKAKSAASLAGRWKSSRLIPGDFSVYPPARGAQKPLGYVLKYSRLALGDPGSLRMEFTYSNVSSRVSLIHLTCVI